jgi:signal recognition particle GTPase
MEKIGGMGGIIGMLPGIGKMKDQLEPPISTTA